MLEEIKNIKRLGVVAYTDSSARPNPGFTGVGIHGYVYDLDEEVTKEKLIENWIITAAGYHRPSKTVTHTLVNPLYYFDVVNSFMEQATNNRGEVTAFLNSLKMFSDKIPEKLHIRTDSEYVVKGITEWCRNWEANNWINSNGSPIVNVNEWRETYYLLSELKDKGMKFSIDWVKGHADMLGNIQADILSVIGMNYSTDRKQINIANFEPAKSYWKTNIERHPFINFKRIYFNSVDRYNITGQYFQADPGGSDFTIGKKMPETGFGIVRLNTPDEVIESVRRKQFITAQETNAILMIKMDNLYNKAVYPYVQQFGEYSLLGNKPANGSNRRSMNLDFINKTPITVEMNPAGLSPRAVDTFNHLEELLDDFTTLKQEGEGYTTIKLLSAHDITDVFYDVEEKQVKKELVKKLILKKEFIVGYRDHFVTIEETHKCQQIQVKVPLVLGIDILPRNNLKRLEEMNPKIHLITWRESDETIRYATIVECTSGIGIWSNYFADRIFLNNFLV